MEYFKDVVGFEGLYQVSNYGRIASLRSEKVLKPVFSKRFKYATINLTHKKTNRNKIVKIHRLVMAAFRGESDQPVNHKDFDRTNNKLDNLEYISFKENTRHAVLAGMHPSCKRRLSVDQVREIRVSKDHPKSLAKKYGVPVSSIYSIWRRTSYHDIE